MTAFTTRLRRGGSGGNGLWLRSRSCSSAGPFTGSECRHGIIGAMSSERRLRSDVFLMFGSKVIVTVLNVAASIIVARALGPTGRGTVAVAIALTMLLVQLGTFGLTSGNPYFAAKDPGARGAIVANS